MKISQLAAALALMILLTANSAIAQRLNAFDSDSSIDTARHTVLLELSTALLTSSLALNYEYQVQPNIALRLGVGTAFQFEGANASGGTVGAQFYTNGSSRLEGGVGLSVLYGTSSAHLPSKTSLAPALNIGYRYQPISGGLMFRVGLSYSYSYGLPVQGSAGYSF